MTINGRDVTAEFLLVCASPAALLGGLLALSFARQLLRSSQREDLETNKAALLFAGGTGVLITLLFGGLWLFDLVQTIYSAQSLSGGTLLSKLASLVMMLNMAIWFTLAILILILLRLQHWPLEHTQTKALAATFDKALSGITRVARTLTRRRGAA